MHASWWSRFPFFVYSVSNWNIYRHGVWKEWSSCRLHLFYITDTMSVLIVKEAKKDLSNITWSTWMSIIKAFRLQDASCSCSRNVCTSSGASGMRKSKFLEKQKYSLIIYLSVTLKIQNKWLIILGVFCINYIQSSFYVHVHCKKEAGRLVDL